jgi:hypothetical protein
MPVPAEHRQEGRRRGVARGETIMTEFWEAAFHRMQLLWGLEPTHSALLAADRFANAEAKSVLIPGIRYGRNAKPFRSRHVRHGHRNFSDRH